MGTLTVRDLDDSLKARLRIRAAENGRSMAAEVRAILRSALTTGERESELGSRIHRRFRGRDLPPIPVPPRSEPPRAAEFPE